MAFQFFNNIVQDPAATFPTNLSVSLTSNEVVLDSVAGNVKALIFNARTGVSALYQTISGANGSNTFTGRVDQAYHGATFAVVYNDRSSSLFTCNTALAEQTLTSNGFDAQGPEFARLRNLDII